MLSGYMANANGQVQGLLRVNFKLIMDYDVFCLILIEDAVVFCIVAGFYAYKVAA